jgi:hypothetical protein
MSSLEKFENDKEFRSSVLRLEGMIDSAIVNAAKNPYNITIPAPEDLTLEIFEVLWKRFTDVGWTSFSWNEEKKTITIIKRRQS